MEKNEKENYPEPINTKGIETILHQMKRCICKIYKDDNVIGAGYFFNIVNSEKLIQFPVLLMNNNIFLSLNSNNNGIIKVSIDEDKTFLNINLDVTYIIQINDSNSILVEIKNEEITKLDIIEISELDNLEKENHSQNTLYTLNLNNKNEVVVFYGNLNKVNNNFFCCFLNDSIQGLSIFSINNFRLIGLIKENNENSKFSKGIFIQPYIKEIILKKKKMKKTN